MAGISLQRIKLCFACSFPNEPRFGRVVCTDSASTYGNLAFRLASSAEARRQIPVNAAARLDEEK
jgi:hypothetical protein